MLRLLLYVDDGQDAPRVEVVAPCDREFSGPDDVEAWLRASEEGEVWVPLRTGDILRMRGAHVKGACSWRES